MRGNRGSRQQRRARRKHREGSRLPRGLLRLCISSCRHTTVHVNHMLQMVWEATVEELQCQKKTRVHHWGRRAAAPPLRPCRRGRRPASAGRTASAPCSPWPPHGSLRHSGIFPKPGSSSLAACRPPAGPGRTPWHSRGRPSWLPACELTCRALSGPEQPEGRSSREQGRASKTECAQRVSRLHKKEFDRPKAGAHCAC